MELSFTLDEKRIQELQQLAAIGYSPKEMALYFDVDPIYFLQAANNVESKIYYYIERGKLLSLATEQMNLLADAEKGTVSASEHLGKIRRSRGWQISKLDIFGGFTDKKLIQSLKDYVDGGSINDLSTEEAIYMDALSLMHGMYRQYGRRNTVSFFVKTYEMKLSRASEMMDEALSLFYRDRNLSKQSMRHMIAENILDGAAVVRENALSSKDWEVYSNMNTQAAKLLQLDKEEPEKLDKEIYMQPLRHFSLNPEDVGLPAINRNELAKQIEPLEIPEREKSRLRQEARLETINLEERLYELEKESKGEE